MRFLREYLYIMTLEKRQEIVYTTQHTWFAGWEKRQINLSRDEKRAGGGRFEFNLSWASGVSSDCPPHLKMNLNKSSNYNRSSVISSKVLIFCLNCFTISTSSYDSIALFIPKLPIFLNVTNHT